MKTPSLPVIDAEQATLIEGGVSISVASSSPELTPSVGRAAGCRVSQDRLQVTVLLPAARCAALLDDLRNTGRIAVAFSEMASHRTIQLKGRDAAIGAADDADLACAAAYAEAFVDKLDAIGFPRARMQPLLASAAEGIIAVRFTPVEAYTQTPGESAGEPLKAGA